MFALGVVAFISPCCFALISVYLVYAVGNSKSIGRGLVIGSSFALATIAVYFFIGYAVSSLIPIGLVSYSTVFLSVSGVLLILFGLSNLGVFKKVSLIRKTGSSLTEKTNSLKMGALNRFSRVNYAVGAFLFGAVISLAIGPCSLSYVLPAILFTLFTAPSALHGGISLSIYGLGQAVPVIVLSVLLASARKVASDRFAKASNLLKKAFGIAFLVIGIIIVVAYGYGGILT